VLSKTFFMARKEFEVRLVGNSCLFFVPEIGFEKDYLGFFEGIFILGTKNLTRRAASPDSGTKTGACGAATDCVASPASEAETGRARAASPASGTIARRARAASPASGTIARRARATSPHPRTRETQQPATRHRSEPDDHLVNLGRLIQIRQRLFAVRDIIGMLAWPKRPDELLALCAQEFAFHHSPMQSHIAMSKHL